MKTDNETYVNEIFDKLDVAKNTVQLLQSLAVARAEQSFETPEKCISIQDSELSNMADALNDIYVLIDNAENMVDAITNEHSELNND